MKQQRWLLLDAIFLVLVLAFITLGTPDVPFHGDESTTIWMSEDYETVILNGNFEAVAYEPPPRRTTEQHMRMITSNVSKVAIGAAWSGAGMEASDLNEQWVWGLDMAWNRANGHMPSERLLEVSRLTSAWMTGLSAVFIFGTTRLIGQQIFDHALVVRGMAWTATGLYAVQPAVLLNGRRAMFEGGLLLGIVMVTWGVIFIATSPQNRRWFSYVMLGVVTGLALSTKHSAAFSVTLLYGGLVLLALRHVLLARQWQKTGVELARLALATILALMVFWLMNPHWWGNSPMQMAEVTVDERQKILDEQVALFGGYESSAGRIDGLWTEMFRIEAQYYEADYWGDYPGVQSAMVDYELSGLAGWEDDGLSFAVRLGSTLLGLGGMAYWLVRGPSGARRVLLVLLFWFAGILMVTLLTVPLGWQRYYLPVQPSLALVMGLGAGTIIHLLSRGWVALRD